MLVLFRFAPPPTNRPMKEPVVGDDVTLEFTGFQVLRPHRPLLFSCCFSVVPPKGVAKMQGCSVFVQAIKHIHLNLIRTQVPENK